MSESFISTRSRWFRLGGLAVLVGLLYVVGRQYADDVSIDSVRQTLEQAGPLGVVGFLGAFAVGNLVSLPGLLFVIASLLAYGKVLGFFIALAGALVTVTLNFWVVRAVGGHAKELPKNRWIRWAMGGLQSHPVRTIAIMRTFLVLSPPLNYALALSPVRFRHYFAGSAIGLIAPLAAYAIGVEWVVACMA